MSESQADTKTCPYCAETIKAAAIKCRFCGSALNDGDTTAATSPSSASSMALLPAVIQDASIAEWFEIGLEQTQLVPIGGPLAFFEVHGIIRNVTQTRLSFHLSIHGRRVVDGQLFQAGLMGQTETPVIAPGQSARWLAKVVTAGTLPDSLRYQVLAQTEQGQNPVNVLDVLESPETLGSMQQMMFLQVATQVRAFEGPAPEGNA